MKITVTGKVHKDKTLGWSATLAGCYSEATDIFRIHYYTYGHKLMRDAIGRAEGMAKFRRWKVVGKWIKS